jgi:NitT/TauT family transport system permease protein
MKGSPPTAADVVPVQARPLPPVGGTATAEAVTAEPPGTEPVAAKARTAVRWRPHPIQVIAPLAVFVLLGVAWQVVAGRLPSVIPPLGPVGASLVDSPGFYLSNLGETLTTAVIGLAIGVACALVLAVIVVHLPWLRTAIMPVAVLVHAMPVVAIAPALIVAFGFGRTPHVIVVVLTTFFPMLINAITGLRSVDSEALDVFRVLAASRWEIFWRLRVPSSLGYLFAAGKTCVTMAMIGAIVSEFTGTQQGIGAVIVQSTVYLNIVQMWGAIFLAAVTSLLLLGLVSLTEKLVIRW